LKNFEKIKFITNSKHCLKFEIKIVHKLHGTYIQISRILVVSNWTYTQ